ncbi:hypothetical protein ACJX0J_011984, partial [Zea mays]
LNERGEQSLSFIAISEIVKRSNFIWHTKESSGHSGGILMGIDMDIYDIGAIDEGDFYSLFNFSSSALLAHMLREEEIKNFFKHNKAPGLDGFPAEFYQAYDNAGGSEEQDGLSILQYADDIINNSDWKTLSGWKGKLMSLSYRGSRENSLLSYILAKWDILCQPKDQGGLGIQNIDLINEDGITFKRIISGKYITCSFTVQSMYMSLINNGNVAASVAFVIWMKPIIIYLLTVITNVYLFAGFLIGLRCIDRFPFLSEISSTLSLEGVPIQFSMEDQWASFSKPG